MLTQKTVDMGFPYGNLTFFILEEVIRRSPDETIFRRDLYMADTGAKDGMVMIRRGDLLWIGAGYGKVMKITGVTEDEIRAGYVVTSPTEETAAA